MEEFTGLELVMRSDNGNGNGNSTTDAISLKQVIANRQDSSMALRESMAGPFEVLEGNR